MSDIQSNSNASDNPPYTQTAVALDMPKKRMQHARNSPSLLEVMGKNRKERRAIAKLNCISPIEGSMKPFVKDK